MATIAPSALYDALKLTDTPASEKVFLTFTVQSMSQSAGKAIRAEMAALGYPDPGRLTVTDPALLDTYRQYATDLSANITETFNSMLANAISRLPDSLSPDEQRAAIQPFLDATHQYNQETLIPFTTQTARQTARNAFYDNNLSPATGKSLTDSMTWTWTRNTDAKDDSCQAAADASPAPRADLEAIAGEEGDATSPPVHQNCLCDLSPDGLDEADLPSADALWDGTGSSQASEPFVFYSDDQPRDEHGRWVGGGGGDSGGQASASTGPTADTIAQDRERILRRVGVYANADHPPPVPSPSAESIKGSEESARTMVDELHSKAQDMGVQVKLTSRSSPLMPEKALGYFSPSEHPDEPAYFPNRIRVANDLDPQATASVLSHEMGHAADYLSTGRMIDDSTTAAATAGMEATAELTSYYLGQHFGIDTTLHTYPYVTRYLLQTSLPDRTLDNALTQAQANVQTILGARQSH